MGKYANVKSTKFKNTLTWLNNHEDVEVVVGGNHNTKVKYTGHGNGSYPISSSHRHIEKRIVKSFMKWLVNKKICTKEEFDARI